MALGCLFYSMSTLLLNWRAYIRFFLNSCDTILVIPFKEFGFHDNGVKSYFTTSIHYYSFQLTCNSHLLYSPHHVTNCYNTLNTSTHTQTLVVFMIIITVNMQWCTLLKYYFQASMCCIFIPLILAFRSTICW
jgi:hypothetical protein